MYAHTAEVDVVEKFVVIFDRHTGAEEHHDLLLPVLLQEGEEEKESLVCGTHDIALQQNGTHIIN